MQGSWGHGSSGSSKRSEWELEETNAKRVAALIESGLSDNETIDKLIEALHSAIGMEHIGRALRIIKRLIAIGNERCLEAVIEMFGVRDLQSSAFDDIVKIGKTAVPALAKALTSYSNSTFRSSMGFRRDERDRCNKSTCTTGA
ncbi:MAG: hypothetical protein Q7S22_08900 [Candidatus Micrarchaeota archaeon]|nr:hypothetical protein [Candidatus Micrarchaeota archaeon]